MKGPFKEQIYNNFSDPAKTCGIKFDFQYMLGAFGCESTLQFNVIAEIESLQLPFDYIKADEELMAKTNHLSDMNTALDNVLD